MKASELMVGDWVYGCTDPYETDRDKKKYPVKVIRIDADGDTMTEGENPFTEPYEDEWWNLEPIPITPEILEKNFREYLPGINLMYQLKGPYFAMNEEGNQWVFGLVKEDGEKSCRYPLVKITYVHELQNALRLCGIEKEIVL